MVLVGGKHERKEGSFCVWSVKGRAELFATRHTYFKSHCLLSSLDLHDLVLVTLPFFTPCDPTVTTCSADWDGLFLCLDRDDVFAGLAEVEEAAGVFKREGLVIESREGYFGLEGLYFLLELVSD